MKIIINEMSQYRLKSFIANYKGYDDFNKSEVDFLVTEVFSTPSIIFTHASKNQIKRDAFLTELAIYLGKIGAPSLCEKVHETHNLILQSELLYRDILKSLGECDISNLSPQLQCWSHIKRAEEEISIIHDSVKKMAKDLRPATTYLLASSIHLTTPEGMVFNPDVAIERIVNCLSLTLSMMTYQFKLARNEKTVLPIETAVSEHQKFQAGSTQLFAVAWKELEDAANRGLLFGGRARMISGNELGKDFVENGILELISFERELSDFEVFDLLAHERRIEKLSQNSQELAYSAALTPYIVRDLDEIKSLDEPKFLSVEEYSTLEAISDTFGFSVFDDQTRYDGLTIRELVRGYATLKYLAGQNAAAQSGMFFTKQELDRKFLRTGLRASPREKFLDLITFQKGSRDLFDSPILELANGTFYFFSAALVAPQLTTIVLSRMTSVEIEVKKKGKAFEKSVLELFKKHAIKCETFKFRRGREEYEYDAVFLFDSRVFVIECKNRGLSGLNAVAAFRKKRDLAETVKQVKRLVRGLENHPEEFKRNFGVDLDQFEIIPLILNSLPFSWAGKIDEVYVTDFSALSRLFKSNAIMMKSIKENGLKEKEMYRLWQGEQMVSRDLINQFENPPQIIHLGGHLHVRQGVYPSGNARGFAVDHVEIDRQEMNKIYQNALEELWGE